MDTGTLLVGAFTLLFGIAFCFLGFKYFRYLLAIWGFIAGFWISEALIGTIFGASDPAVIAGWIVGLIGGLALAGLSYFLYNAAVAILGATFGLWFVAGLLTWIGMESSLLVAILAILGAILFAVLTFQDSVRKYLVIAITALIGATGIVSGLLFLFGPLTVEVFRSGQAPLLPSLLQELWLALVLWLLLAVLGAAVQWLTTREPEAEALSETGITSENEVSNEAIVAAEEPAIES